MIDTPLKTDSDTNNVMPERVDSKLRWRCRRGMLELDILLNHFVDTRYVELNHQQKTIFDQVLDYPDQLLFDLFLGHMESSDNSVSDLVKTIRQSVTL